MGKSVKAEPVSKVVIPNKVESYIPTGADQPFGKSGFEYNKYDAGLTNTEYSERMKFRQARQGIGEAFGNSMGQILTTIAGQTLQGIDALTVGGIQLLAEKATGQTSDFSSPIGDMGAALQDWGRESMPIWADQSAGFESLNYILSNLPNVASTVSMLIPQMGAARLIGGLGKALRASQIATQLAQVGGGALVGRHIENTMEASQVYKDVYGKALEFGLTEEEAKLNASEAATMDYKMNYANLVFDVVQLGSILKPLKAMPKIGAAGSRFNAVSEVGYEAANKRAISMTGKSLLDGASIYEKAAIQGYRYFGAPLGQVTEGIEEFWNTTSQRESTRAAALEALEKSDLKYTDPDKYEEEKKKYDPDTTFMERIGKYTGEKEFKDSFIWGWIGGTMYSALGKPVGKAMNAIKGNEPQLYGSIKAKDFAERNNLIKEHLKVENDPRADEVTLLQSKNKNIFGLAESALRAGNMDVLIEDLQDDAYIEFIAKQNNIDLETAKKNVGELRTTLEEIAKDYNGFVGYNFDGYKGFQEYVNVQPFDDLSTVQFDFGDRIEPEVPFEYSVKSIASKLKDGESVRLDLDVRDDKGESIKNYVVATKVGDKLMRDGQEITFSDKQITDARKATPVEDVESFEVKRKGLFGFVQPEVGMHLTRMSFFSKMAEKEGRKAAIEATKILNEKYAESNPMVVGFGDMIMRRELTKSRAEKLKKQIAIAKKSKVSETTITELEEELKEADSRANALNEQVKAQQSLIEELMTGDFQVTNGMAFAGQTANDIMKTMNLIKSDSDLYKLYAQTEDANMVKKKYAKERQRIIKDPVGYYKTLLEDNSKFIEYEENIKKDRDVYGIDETDTEETKTIKRQMVDLFKDKPDTNAPGYDAALIKKYEDEKNEFKTKYATNPPTDNIRQEGLNKVVEDMKRKVGTPEFDMLKFIEAKAELDVLRQVAAKAKTKQTTAKAKAAQEATEEDEDTAEMDKKFVTAADTFFNTVSELLDPATAKDPNDFTFVDSHIAAEIIDPYNLMKRFYELYAKGDSLTEVEKKELVNIMEELNNPLYSMKLEMFINQKPITYLDVINYQTGAANIMYYSQEYVDALKDALREAGQEFAKFEWFNQQTNEIISVEEAEKRGIVAGKEAGDEKFSKWYRDESSWSGKDVLEGNQVFDFIGFVEKGLPNAKAIFLSKIAELQAAKEETETEEEQTHTVISEANEKEVESGLASSLEPEPKGGPEGVTIVHQQNLSVNQYSRPAIEKANTEGDQFVDVFRGKMISKGFDENGKPLLNPELSLADYYDFSLMNPDRAGGAALQAGDIVEVRKEKNAKGETFFSVYKVDKKGDFHAMGTISDSTKNNNLKSIAAEQAFAKLFEQSKKEQSTNIDLVNETTALLNSLPDVVMNSQDNPEPLKKIIKWAEKVYGVEFKGDFKKGEYVSFFQGLDNAGYLASSKISGPKAMLQELIKGATYQAKIKNDTNEEIKAIRFQLDALSVGFGDMIQTEKVSDAPKSMKKALPLSEVTDITAINNRDRTDSIHLGVFDGNIVGTRDNGLKPVILPNGVIKGAPLNPDLSGQVIALVPTNTVYSGVHNAKDAGKQAYIKVPMHTADLGSIKVNGMTMPSLVLEKMSDPVNNIDFIKSLAQMVGINFGDTVTVENLTRLYTEKNLITIFGNLMFLKGALKGDGVAAKNYKYPIHIDVKVDKTKGTIDLQIENIEPGAKRNKLYIPVILPDSGVNNDVIKQQIKDRLMAFDATYLKNKPFAVNAARVNDNTKSGPYVGFGIVNGEIAVKTYPSYLHYLDENKIVTGTFASVPLLGQNRRTFFEKPRVVINFERANLGEDGIMRGPSKAASTVGIGEPVFETSSNPTSVSQQNIISDQAISDLENKVLKTAVLKTDESAYQVGTDEYDRVHTAMGKEIPESDLLDKAKLFGNTGDLAIREFLNTGTVNFDNYPALADYKDAFLIGAANFQKRLEQNGERVIQGETTIYGRLVDKDGNERKIAGATDIVTIDKKNKVRIYDTKTMRGKVTKDAVASRAKDWSDQLNMYRELFKYQGYMVEEMFILPIGIDYGTFNDKIVGIDFTGQLIEIPKDDKGKYVSQSSRDITKPFEVQQTTSTGETKTFTEADILNELNSMNFEGFANPKSNRSKNSVSDLINLDGDKNMYKVLKDDTLDEQVRFSITRMVESTIMDVLFDQTVLKRNGDLNVETSLKPKVKAALRNQLDYFVSQAAIAKNAGNTETYNKMLLYAKYRQEALNRFDPVDYTPEYKAMLGDFAGYFKTAYIGVTSNKLVDNSIRSSEIDDIDTDFVNIENDAADKAPNRIQDEYYTKINPKSTVSFQAKLFLSRITVKDEYGNVERDESGTAKYYTLDEMLQRLFNYMDLFGPTAFSENTETLKELASSQNDTAMSDLLGELEKLDNLYDKETLTVQWPFTKGQIMSKLAGALIKHNRNTKIVMMDYKKLSDTHLVGGMNTKIIDSNRQNLQFQIQTAWDGNFKGVLDEFYVTEEKTDNAASLAYAAVAKLRTTEFGKYEKIGNSGTRADVVVPTISDENDASRLALEMVYDQLIKLRNMAESKPKEKFYVAFPEGDAFDIRNEAGDLKGTLTTEDFKTALRLVTLPENVFVPKELTEGMSDSILGNMTQGVSQLLNMIDGNFYSPAIYRLLSEQLYRVGINMAENGDMGGAVLQTLQNRAYGDKSVFQSLDPKATSVKQFLRETLLDGIFNRLANADGMSTTSLENPYGDFGLALSKLSRVAKVGFPSLINPNSTSIFGENEYTVVNHTYLSYKTKQFKNNNDVREFYLTQNALTKDSLHVRELFAPGKDDDRKAFEVFDVHDIRGVNFNNRNKLSNKTLNETQRAILDYNVFQNGESVDTLGRGVGYFTTTHGESTTIPALSMMKQGIAYMFIVDENLNVSMNLIKGTRFYDILFSQFKGEVNAVIEAEQIFRKIEQVEQTKGLEEAIKFAEENYTYEKHYKIKDGKLLPGTRTKFYMFGNDMFEDTKGLIYDKSTSRLDADMFRGLLNPLSEAGEINETFRIIEDNIFWKYANGFLNSLVDNEIAALSANEGEWFIEDDVVIGPKDDIEGNKVVGVKFPLFNNAYAFKMTKRLLMGGNDTNNIRPMMMYRKGVDETPVPTTVLKDDVMIKDTRNYYPESFNNTILSENESKRQNKLFGQLQKHYMVADFVLNYLVFYNTYDALYSDNVSFGKADNYYALMEEKNKRYKTLMGPGTITAGNMEFDVNNKSNTNLVYTHIIQDVRPVDLQRDMLRVDLDSNMKYADFLKWVQSLPNDKLSKSIKAGFNFTNPKTVGVPSNLDEVASMYVVNKSTMGSEDLKSSVSALLNQEMTDGGAVIDLREQIARFVRNGELDINRAPQLYEVLSNPELTYEQFEKAMKDFNLNRSTFQISKNIYSGTTATNYQTAVGEARVDEFTILKNSEIVIIPAFAKTNVWADALKDADRSLQEFLRSKGIDPKSPESFMFGNILAFKSNVKSASRIPTKAFDNNGKYIAGSIGTNKPLILSREHFRNQGGKNVKDEMLTTSSTQLQQMSLIGIDSQADFSTNNSYGIKIKEKISGSRIAKMRYDLDGQFTEREMNKIFNRIGVKMVGGKPVIQDYSAFIKSMSDQVVNQQGIGLHLEAFKLTPITGSQSVLRAPLSYTPFNIIAQNVLLNQFNKAIQRKISGISLIQASTFGMFAKDNIKIDNTLKGSRIEIEDSGRSFFTPAEVYSAFSKDDVYKIEPYKDPQGVQLYRAYIYKVMPSEIAMGWNLRDGSGNLLKYEDYVDPVTMLPLPGKIDESILYGIGYRTPNTPHNTTSYTKVVKFLPPMYKDVVLVSPQMMTAMSSDLDVDVLNVMFYEYTVDENGKLNKVSSVLSEMQDNIGLLNSTANKTEVFQRMLNSDYDYSRLKKLRDKKLSLFLRKQGELLDILNNERLTVADKVDLLKARGLDASELKSLLDTLVTVQENNPDVRLNQIQELIEEDNLELSFPDEYNAILDSREDITDEEAYTELKKQVNALKKKYAKESRKFRSETVDEILDQIKGEIKELTEIVTDGSSMALIELDTELENLERKSKFNFEKNYNGMSLFEKQNDKQLNNALIDTFVLQYSSPTGYKLSSQPLNTNLLKDKVESKNLTWENDKGEVVATSFEEAIVNSGFRALNSVTTRRKAKSAAQDNGAMIGVFANALRLMQYASAAALYVNSSTTMKSPMMYASSKKDSKGLLYTETVDVNGQAIPKLKTEEGMNGSVLGESIADTSIHQPGYHVYNWNNPAFKTGGSPDINSRYRLDRIYHIDNNGERSYAYKIMLQSLQAVLDGVKDPIASKMGLNMNNINAYIAHVMLGHFDEVIPLFRQPAVEKYLKDVVENTVEKVFPSDDVKMDFINKFIKENNIKGLNIIPEGVVPAGPIRYLELLLNEQNIIVSEASLKADLVQAYNLDGRNRTATNDFQKRQLMALLNYMRAEAIGQDLTTTAISLNPYAKGLPGTILEVEEVLSNYGDLLKTTYQKGEAVITSSVPLIGNIANISTKQFAKNHTSNYNFRPAFVGVEHTMDNVVKPLVSMFSSLTDNNVFTELSPLNRLVYNKMNTRMGLPKKLRARQKMDIALAFNSFMFSNPELYRGLFTNDEEYQIFKEYGIEALVLRNNQINPDLAKKLNAIEDKTVLISDSSLAELIDKVKNKKTAKGVANKNIYKLLGAVRELKNNNKQGNADLVLYMNIADFKNGFNAEYMLTINQMLESGDPEIEAVAKQLILYAYMSGGISSPNSFIKFISQGTVKETFSSLTENLNALNHFADKYMSKEEPLTEEEEAKLTEQQKIDRASKIAADSKMRQSVNDLVNSFAIQYFQHNPTKAPMLKKDYKVGKFIKDNLVMRYYDEDLHRVVIPVRNASGDLAYYGKRPVIKEYNEDGSISLYMFQRRKDGNAYVSIDTAGNSRYNFREYSYTETGKAVNSMIARNVKGGKRGMILKQMQEDAETFVPQRIESFVSAFTSDKLTGNRYLVSITRKESAHHSFANEAQKRYARYVVEANLYPISIIPEESMDNFTFGEYDQQTDTIHLNANYIRKYGPENPERVIETINHELTHAAIDRAVSSWLNPNFRVQDEDGAMVPFLDANQRNTLNQPMMMLNATIKLTAQALNDKKGQYHKLLKVLVDRYKAAQKEGDIGAMKDLAFVPAIFQRIEQYVKLYGVEGFDNPTKLPQRTAEAYTEINKEFVAYFMTNREFQTLLNQVELDKGKKSLWRQLVDAFLEILDVLTGGAGLRRLTKSEQNLFRDNIEDASRITENTLAHVTAVASMDLINATGTFRNEEVVAPVVTNSRLRPTAVENMDKFTIEIGATEQQQFYIGYGSLDKKGPFDELGIKSSNFISIPIKKTAGNDAASFFTKDDIPYIEQQFDKAIAMASDYDKTYYPEDMLNNSFADYKARDKKVYAALSKGLDKLKRSLDKKSQNRIDLLGDLLDFKFDQAEIEEVSAYKNCK